MWTLLFTRTIRNFQSSKTKNELITGPGLISTSFPYVDLPTERFKSATQLQKHTHFIKQRKNVYQNGVSITLF